MKKYFFLLVIVLTFFSCKEDKNITSITMRENTCSIATGESHKLTFSYAPFDAEKPIVQWISSNPSVVSIDNINDFGCEIFGRSVGNAIITCTELSTGNRLNATCEVSVYSNAKFSSEVIYVEKGKFIYLSDYIEGSSGYIYWESGNTSICTIESGILYAHEIGECTITGFIQEYNTDIRCKVVVTPVKPTEIKCEDKINLLLDNELEIIAPERWFEIQYSLYPEDAVANVTLTSSNTNIIEVIDGMKIHTKQYGTATLTLTTDNGISKTIQATVTDITGVIEAKLTMPGSVIINGQMQGSGNIKVNLRNHSMGLVTWLDYTIYSNNGAVLVAQNTWDAVPPQIGIGQTHGEEYAITIPCANVYMPYCIITYEYYLEKYTLKVAYDPLDGLF